MDWTKHPELVRQVRRDMATEMMEQMGPGYVTRYYTDLAAPFASIALSFAEQIVAAETGEGRTDDEIKADAWEEGMRAALEALSTVDRVRNPYRDN